jgi:hypothetical protein
MHRQMYTPLNTFVCIHTCIYIFLYSGREVRELGFTWDIASQATVTPEDSGLTDIDYTVEPFSDAISNGRPRVCGGREMGEIEGGGEERERARESNSERERARENE